MGRRPDNHHDVDNDYYYDSCSNHDYNCSVDVANCNDGSIRVNNVDYSAPRVDHKHVYDYVHHHYHPANNHNYRTGC